MDLAFALALLDATRHPPVLTAEAKQIQARLQEGRRCARGRAGAGRADTAAEGKASGAQKDALDDQLELAKAQLELRRTKWTTRKRI